MIETVITLSVLGVIGIATLLVKAVTRICAPNQALVVSSLTRRSPSYRVVTCGSTMVIPLVSRLDRLDLSPLTIEAEFENVRAQGGVPLNVKLYVVVRLCGDEPLVHRAVEKLAGKTRAEIIHLVRQILESRVRAEVSPLLPEEFAACNVVAADRLQRSLEAETVKLGILVDVVTVHKITDTLGYFEAKARRAAAESLCAARIEEARARAEAAVCEAENSEREALARIEGMVEALCAEIESKRVETSTHREALISEEKASVLAQIAEAKAELDLHSARVEHVRKRLEAEVVEPAYAAEKAASIQAVASSAFIAENGRAKADALRSLGKYWAEAGEHAAEALLLQKLEGIVAAVSQSFEATRPVTAPRHAVVDLDRLSNSAEAPAEEQPQGDTVAVRLRESL